MDSDSKVEKPIVDGTLTTAAPQSHKDESTVEPPQQTENPSTHRNSRKKGQSKSRKKKSRSPYRPAYLDFIQQEIDDLKQNARHTYEIQARQNLEGELVDDEKTITEKRMAASTAIDKLEALKQKLDTPDMLQKSRNDYSHYHTRISDRKSDHNNTSRESAANFQQETLTLLHFFYIVRLAQKGFFTLISQQYPNVEPDALVYLCDKLVGGSLFVVKDPEEKVRSSKRNQVFDTLQKLHNGAPESIGGEFITTFEQVRHLIYDFIGSTATTTATQGDDDTTPFQTPRKVHPQYRNPRFGL
ncbi:hypothetical protein BCR42DRAFT_234569 [Absidia repens]|uniref:Uncharacterized protein n=1 Tax=Absidia repens TaxID=90262 RepID=A0A1X2IM95_9FUNG|nr:hypothetical protein BCR42DRAFT_234569 [Absidia repens]